MLEVVLSNRFKKDLKLAARRGLPLDELNTVVDWLAPGRLCRIGTVTTLSPEIISASGSATSGPTGCSFTVWTAALLSFSCSVPVRIRICLIRIFH